MKNFVANLASSFKAFAAVAVIAVLAFGCEKEVILPEHTAAEMQFGAKPNSHRPETQCGTSTFATMNDGSTVLGNVEILNNTDKTFLVFTMGMYKFIDEVRIFVGDINALPTNGLGQISTELFPIQPVLAEPANELTINIPNGSLQNTCNQIVIWARVNTLNIWGQATQTQTAWMTGAPVGNGFATSYCLGSCLSGNTALNIAE